MNHDVTRAAFAGVIDRPQLTDQLLDRPPFKFLHDVIMNTLTATGYLKDEMSSISSSSLNDKAAKIAFLETVINLVNTDGELDDVKAAKIVAGKDPELTSKFLRKLAATSVSASKKSGNKENKKEKKSSSKEKSEKSEKKEKKSSSSSKDKSSKDKEKAKEPKDEKKSRSKSRDREAESSKNMSSKDDKKEKKDKDEKKEKKEKKSSSSKEKKDDKKEKKEKKVKRETEPTRIEEPPVDTGKTEDSGVDMETPTHEVVSGPPPPAVDSPRPPPLELRNQAARVGTSSGVGRPQTSLGRPGTAAARPAPPKLKKKMIAEVEPAVSAPAEVVPEIISEVAEPVEEDDFLVEEQEQEQQAPREEEMDGEHGGLVSKIMETRAELEETAQTAPDEDLNEDMGRERLQVESLQKTLQKVTQTAFPLSRLFDFAQEDLESMIKEMEKWRAETRKNEALMADKEATLMGDAQRFTIQLQQLDDEIKETKSILMGVRSRIVENETRLKVLIANM